MSPVSTGMVRYEWLSYEETERLAHQFRRGVQLLSNTANSAATQQDVQFLVLFAGASVEWYLAQYACLVREGLVVVPVNGSVSASALAGVLRKCGDALLAVVTSVHLEHVVNAALQCCAGMILSRAS